MMHIWICICALSPWLPSVVECARPAATNRCTGRASNATATAWARACGSGDAGVKSDVRVFVGEVRVPGIPCHGRLRAASVAVAALALVASGCTAGTTPGFPVAQPTVRVAGAIMPSGPLTPAPNVPGTPENGRALFASKGCIGCHTLNGYPGATGVEGPNLTNMPLRPTIAGETIQNSADNLARWIQDPPSMKPGTRMPNLGLSSQEARDLAAYLYSVPYNPTR